MRLRGLLGAIAFRLAIVMAVVIVATGALVLWQVDGILRDHEENRVRERLIRGRAELEHELDLYQDLAVTAAAVLAGQADMREAVADRDPAAILRIAAEYYQQTGTTLPGAPGLQVYGPAGELVVRAHDPLRGSQVAVPIAVQRVLDDGIALGSSRDDELLGIAISGIAPVADDRGRVLGAVEALSTIDDSLLGDFNRRFGLRIALVDYRNGVVGGEAYEGLAPLDASLRDLTQGTDGSLSTEPMMLDLGGEPHLSVFIPVTAPDGERVGDLYIGVPRSEILAGIDRVRAHTLRVTAITGLVAVALASAVAFVAVRPIRELVDAARRIQSNDLDTPVRPRGAAEVLELGAALEELRLAVRQTREAMLSVNRDLASRFDASTASLSEVSQELAVMHGILGALGGGSADGLTGIPNDLAGLDWVDGAAVALATEEGKLSMASTSSINPTAAAMLLAIIEGGVRGQQLEAGLTVVDTAGRPETRALAHQGIGGFAAQPIVQPDGVAGVVMVTTRRPLRLIATRIDLLRSVAREIAAMLERSELASEVEENRRIAESVLREMSDGVLVIDFDNRCRVANPAAARLLGRSRVELVGKHAEDILPLGQDAVETLRRRAAQNADGPVAPLLAETNGRKVAISAGPFVDIDPERSGMMVLMRDLTAEAEADRVKQDFVSTVGHELRTPLTLIRTTIDLLNEGDAGALNETQARIVEVLHANTDRLMLLINDLLDMSAIDSGRLQIQPQLIDVREMAGAVLAEANPAASAKQHQLHLFAPEDTPAWADRRRIAQVLSNLVGNAIKYTPPGGVIEVIVEHHEPWVQVAVRDNGIGIPADEQAQLFEKFYRTSQGRRTTGGTGLGLAIARSLVELHGGRIWCESDGQSGSTFAFTLPTRQI